MWLGLSLNFKRMFCNSLGVSPCSSCDNMIRAKLAHCVMSLEQRGKVSTQITITRDCKGSGAKSQEAEIYWDMVP